MLILALAGGAFGALAGGLVLYLAGYFEDPGQSSPRLAVVGLIALFPTTVIGAFLNVALASAAGAALEGRPISVREAISRALSRLPQIALWSLLAMGVGILLDQIASRLPGGGAIAKWVAGAAWSLATIFVIPLLALEGCSAVSAVRQSTRLVRQRWGEGLAGTLTIGAWVVLAIIPLCMAIGVGGSLSETAPAAAAVILSAGVVGILVVSFLAAAVRQVFAVALYRYASAGATGAFPGEALEQPFSLRDPQRWWGWLGVLVAAIFLLAVVAGALHHEEERTGANGYYYVNLASSVESELREGMPVVYRGQRIGEVVDVFDVAGERVRAVYKVDLEYRHRDLRTVTIEGAPDETVLALHGLRPRPPHPAEP